jgi:hypothetical protein
MENINVKEDINVDEARKTGENYIITNVIIYVFGLMSLWLIGTTIVGRIRYLERLQEINNEYKIVVRKLIS